MRWIRYAALAFASISLAVSLLQWWMDGGPVWGGVTSALGILMIAVAIVIGPTRRGTYISLIAGSLMLWGVTMALRFNR